MRATLITLAAILATVAITDAAFYVAHGWRGTYSHLILSRSQRYPILAFIAGIVAGHLFWPQPDAAPTSRLTTPPPPDPSEAR